MPSGWTNWQFWQDADNGNISGIPAANTAGNYLVTVTATDSANVPVKGSAGFTLTVAGGLFMTTSGTSSQGNTILLVEDDEGTAELEKRVLTRSGLSVRVVNRVRDAVALLERESFAAILLDYQLPDGDPWAVVEAANAKVPRIPVILVTAMVTASAVVADVHHRLYRRDGFGAAARRRLSGR